MRLSFLLAATAAFSIVGAPAVAADRYWPPITDPPTNTYQPGRWVWADLVTSDVGTAAEFYGKVLGWTFATTGGADDRDTYTVVYANGLPIGGMVFPAEKVRDPKAAARWIGFMSVPDVTRASTAVETAGGKVIMKPRKLGERGEAAVFADPEGAPFGVIHSAVGDPEDYFGDEREWMWIELWATDARRMGEFYRAIGGYDVESVDNGSARTQLRLKAGDRYRAGIMSKLDVGVRSTWLPYVRVASVADTVAKAREAGGRIMLAPTQAHGTRVAVIIDPTGAPFAVAEWPGK
jgi:hypothetical protein